MIRLSAVTFSLLYAVAATLPLHAQSAANDQFYTVEVALSEGLHVLGRPTLRIRPGKQMIMTNEDAGYSLRTTLTPVAERGVARAKVAFEIYRARSDGWVKVAAPTISAPLGAESSFESAAGAGTGAVPIRLSVTVTEAAP